MLSETTEKEKDPFKSKEASLLSFFEQLYYLYRPHFGLKKNKFWRTLTAGAMVFNAVLSAFVMSLINTTMNSFVGVLGADTITYTAYFGVLWNFLLAILVYSCFTFANDWLSAHLGDSLSNAMNKKYNKCL